MNYKEFQDIIIDYLSDNLTADKRKEFELFLSEHKDFQKEFEATKLFWNNTVEKNEPTSRMDMNFYSMLAKEESKNNKIGFFKRIMNNFSIKLVKQLSYGLTILTIGFFIGNFFNNSKNSNVQNLKVAKAETENVRSQLVLTLLDQPQANQRLQAVNEARKLNKVTETILKALFTTLNNDENVNVRLSAIEALKKYTHLSLVREGLVSSIAKQESPLVQIALADVMVLLQEKKALKPFKKLIEKEDINTSAKQKIKESIEKII